MWCTVKTYAENAKGKMHPRMNVNKWTMNVSMGNDTMFNQNAEINSGWTDEMVVTIIFRNSVAKVQRLNYFIIL